MIRATERLLNLRPGDFKRGSLIALYYFLVISSYVIGQSARDALFLAHFTPAQLPYVEFAMAVVVGPLIAAYIRIGRHVDLRNLVIGSLMPFALSGLLLWWIASRHPLPWVYPIIYVWVGIFGVLGTMQVWTIANYVLTTREAKRLFGLIGGGGILGGIFGGFSSNAIAKGFGTEALLLVVTICLSLCIVVVFAIYKRARVEPADSESTRKEGPNTLSQSLRLVLSSAHLRTIAMLICVSSIVTNAAGWQLKAIAKQVFVDKDAMAAFFGSFNGYMGIFSLVAQLLVTTRVLGYFGVGIALFFLPVALMGGSALVLMSGALWAAIL